MQLSIGYDGSCAEVGVMALADIPRGARLAMIPRHALLNATNSRVGVALRRDRKFQKQLKDMNSWVPLLLALLAEYGDKVSVVRNGESRMATLASSCALSIRERLTFHCLC